MKKEYYILSGEKGMKKKMIESGINLSNQYLMIVARGSKLGKGITKEIDKRYKKEIGGNGE